MENRLVISRLWGAGRGREIAVTVKRQYAKDSPYYSPVHTGAGAGCTNLSI
jgi:hypothetical protein